MGEVPLQLPTVENVLEVRVMAAEASGRAGCESMLWLGASIWSFVAGVYELKESEKQSDGMEN